MSVRFRPPTPVPIAGGGGGGGTSIVNDGSSVAVNVDPTTGENIVQITTNDTAALTVDNNQYVIIGNKTGVIPSKRLTLVDSNGQGLQIINSTASSASSLSINSNGALVISTSGSAIEFGSNNLYTALGSMYINGIAMVASADQINYIATIEGIAQESKALVVDVDRNIVGINSLEATSLTGLIQTAHQPHINSLVDVGIQSLSLQGAEVLATATELNYLSNVVLGTASPSKPLMTDANKNIAGLGSISAASLSGTLTTSSQPNITSIGALMTLVVNEAIGLGTANPTCALDIVADSPAIRLNGSEISVDGLGNLSLSPTNDVLIKPHADMVFLGTSEITGLHRLTATTLTGVLTTASQPNITSVGTLTGLIIDGNVDTTGSLTGQSLRLVRTNSLVCDIGVSSDGDLELVPTRDLKLPNGKALRMSGPIIGVSDLTATTLTGTLQTAAQPNITSIGTLGSLTVTNAIQAASVSATTLTGTLATVAQPNITSVGTLGSLTIANGLTAASVSATNLTGTLQTPAQPKITSVGTLVDLTVAAGIEASSLIVSTITGTLQTAAQPNITSIGTLGSLAVANAITAGSVVATTVSGTLQTADQSNIIKVGTLGSLDVSNTITATSVSASSITGTLQTGPQPNITSIGVLPRLLLTGPVGVGVDIPTSVIDIDTSDTDVDAEFRLTDGQTTISFGIGADGAIIDTDGQYLTLGSGTNLRFTGGLISGLTTLTATTLTGTLQTAAQPNITSVGTLTHVDTGNIGIGTPHSDQYRLNILDPSGNIAMISDGSQSMILSVVNDDYTINTSNNRLGLGTNVDLVINGGTVVGLDHLTTNTISGVLTTPDQSNITSVGELTSLTVDGPMTAGASTLTSLDVSGDISVGGRLLLTTPQSFTSISSANATFDSNLPALSSTNGGTLTVIGGASFSKNVVIGESLKLGGITLTESSFTGLITGAAGTVEASKIIVAGPNKDITGFRNLTAEHLFGSVATDYQPNITTVGNLTNLNVNGYLGVGTTSPMKQLEINTTAGECVRMCFNKATQPASFVDFTVDEFGSGSITPSGPNISLHGRVLTDKITLGNTGNSTMPLEIGFAPFTMTQPYAYNSSANGKGIINPNTSGLVSYNYSIRALGRILCTQSLDVMSDKRTKKNIVDLTDEYCTSFIERTTPVSFNWRNGDSNKSFGYIAQELVRNGFEDLVNLAHDASIGESIDDDGFINPAGVKFTISYQHIIPILAKNQRRLMAENEEIKLKLDAILELLQRNGC